MADIVRRLLEEMVPELEDLEKRGYFSKTEIKQIVQRRQDFEYALRRRAALKSDFLRYADYELALERLRQLRRKQRAIGGPSSLADHSIVRRIHFIYERACRKFRGDLSLWSRWVQFCQYSKSSRQMSRVLTRALQLHPTCAALWTYAAAWEFEHNLNATAARALMQRGLRMCKDNPALWHEYFRMELLYAARLAARREVLGLSVARDSDVVEENQQPSDGAAEALLRGAVAKVVYKNAVGTPFGDSVEFRMKFLDVLGPVTLPGHHDLATFILEDVTTAFPNSPNVVTLKARKAVEKARSMDSDAGKCVNEALAVFKSCFESSPSGQLFDAALKFFEGLVHEALEGENAEDALILVRTCLEVVELAVNAGFITAYIAMAAPKIHLRLGQLSEALHAASSVTPQSSDRWVAIRQRMGLQALANTLGSVPQQSIEAILLESLQNISVANREPGLWSTALRTAIAHGESLDVIHQRLQDHQLRSLTGPLQEGMGFPTAALFAALWTIGGPAIGRRMYKEFLTPRLPSGEFVHAILDAELSLVASGDKSALSLSEIREIFEKGIATYGADDVELWLKYHRFEQEHGDMKNASLVHWRAIKTLNNADNFVLKSQLINLGILI